MSEFDCIIQIETVKNVQMIKGGERMLLEERLDEIVKIVNERGSISNQELVKMFGASESTIRRDITTLANDNRVIRVHGGAMSVVSGGGMEDSEVSARRIQNSDEKIKIAKYAASLINDGAKDATFVTNALSHAVGLARKGFKVYIIGGLIKSVTEAIIDSEAIISLSKYNFTKGFFGTNGLSSDRGFTTPDVREADIKNFAMRRCAKKFVLCDSSKFNKISKATFAAGSDITVITDKITENIKGYNIKEAAQL